MRRTKRRKAAKERPPIACGLCDRLAPKGFLTRHHCSPKGIRGPVVPGEIARICVMCHKMVHHIYTHKTLRARYTTLAALRAAPDLQEFLAWVKTRPVTEVIKFTEFGKRL